MRFPPAIQKLISQFTGFPGVGSRTAARFVLYLLKLPEKDFNLFLTTAANLRQKVQLCTFCHRPFEPEHSGKLCDICSNTKRDTSKVCIVERETDLLALEKTKKFKGLYYILSGTVNRLEKDKLVQQRIKQLPLHIKQPEEFGIKGTVKEVILATNATAEGEATRLYIMRQLKPSRKKITTLGRGLPTGAELEYADDDTLSASLEHRQ
jgi:recombination protein RecR